MENFTVPNKQLYTQCLNGFNNWVSNTIDLPIVNILGIHPTELETFFSEIKGLTRLIGGVPTDPGANTRIAECISPKDQALPKPSLL